MKKTTLDLGCGKKKTSGAIGIDNTKLDDVDVIADIRGILPFKSSSCDEIICSQVIEHLSTEERISTLKEINRLLKKNGKLIIMIPHREAWRTNIDPTHKATNKLILSMFDYFEPNHNFSYYFDFHFRIIKNRIEDISLFFPAKNIEILGKHPIWVLIHLTLDSLTKFIANKWEPILKFLPVEMANMFFELQPIKEDD